VDEKGISAGAEGTKKIFTQKSSGKNHCKILLTGQIQNKSLLIAAFLQRKFDK
jgi:hypothetical protein